ncbi:hypothetical protein S83_018378, partial [Arachis hypogaea]
ISERHSLVVANWSQIFFSDLRSQISLVCYTALPTAPSRRRARCRRRRLLLTVAIRIKFLCEVRQLSRYDPCTEKYAEIYYNRSDVQKALHANTTGIPYKWTACIEVLNRNWNDTDVSVLPIYRQLMANRIRVWVFSGDVDSVVPVTATRYALAQLKVATKIPWYP